MQAEKARDRFRGKIYFCNKDSSLLGTVSTEQFNHQMRRLVKHNSPMEPWLAGLAEGHLHAQAGPEGLALQRPGGGVRIRLKGGQGGGGLETNPGSWACGTNSSQPGFWVWALGFLQLSAPLCGGHTHTLRLTTLLGANLRLS